ncbi:MAG: hypothetical protein IK014_00610 [Lachnospiraceae bacterium]|nr:hypothetical protein [Lachnospiraceae bacterium]
MSKCNSNHFTGTTSLRNSALHTSSESDIIAERVQGLDLRPHPTKQMGSKRMTKVKVKINARTATKDEYQLLRHTERLNERRDEGVRAFWEQERERIISGKKTTRTWNSKQRESILNVYATRPKGINIQGHHTYAVSQYPHLANRGEVIFPVTFYEHLHIWHGGSFFKSSPGRPVKSTN